MPPEPVSVVILSRGEPDQLVECVERVLPQLDSRDEIVIVDAGSPRSTLELIDALTRKHPDRIRAHALPESADVAVTRATALDLARHDALAFVRADAVPTEGWLDAMRRAIANADVAYGRQRHAPVRKSAASAARGLRYARFEGDADALPERYASDVNAAYRRFAFETLPVADDMPTVDDRAFARRARLAGLRIVYAPDAIVERRDATTLRAEWREQMRFGAAHALARDLIGAPTLHIVWATLVAVLAIAAIALANVWLLAATIAVFFAPAFRRVAAIARARYRAHHLAGAVAVSPMFDLAFIASYLARRTSRKG